MKQILTSRIVPSECWIAGPTLAFGDKESEKAAGPEQNQINPPKVDEKTGEITQKAISSAKQAHGIAKGLRDRAREGRFVNAATIADKYNGNAPFDPTRLRNLKQNWRNNFSTQFLPSIIDRVRPQFKKPIENAERITYSCLPAYMPDSAEKSRKFGVGITKLIRNRPGWDDFVNQLTQEEILYGNAVPAWLDDSWMPVYFGYSETFLPEGTLQHASKVQTAVFGEQKLIHEFLDKIRDKQAATDAGYKLSECYKAVNEVAGSAQKDETPLDKTDIVREQGVLNYSYANQQKTIDMFHVVQREYDGKMALWTVSQKSGFEIRHVEDLHEDSDAGFEDVCTLFTLQTGNRKFYGSKGLGRMLANITIALERGRCLAADMAHLSGLLVIQADSKDINTIQPRVVHPFLVLPKNVIISKEHIEFDPQKYDVLDNKLVTLAESIAGAFIPPNLDQQGASNTTIEAAQKAEREMAVRQGVLGRFFKQFADLVSAMQRKICSPLNIKEAQRIFTENKARQQSGLRVLLTRVGKLLSRVFSGRKEPPKIHTQSESQIADKDAVNFLVDMLTEGLTVEEIAILALAPAGNGEQANMEAQDAQTVAFLTEQAQNPFIDQKEATRMVGEIRIGQERTERVMQRDINDPNEEAGETRLQLMEIGMMMSGVAMPVSQTDDHRIHRKIIAGHATPVFGMLETSPTVEFLRAGELILAHYIEHLEKDTATTPEEKAKEQEGVAGWAGIIEKSKGILQEAAEAAIQAGAGGDPNEIPTPISGSPKPLQADAEGNLHDAQANLDAASRVADTAFRAREMDLKEKDQAHRHEIDKAKVVGQLGKTAADILKAQQPKQGLTSSEN